MELIKPCSYEAAGVPKGFMIHLNFKAKSIDHPTAPVEMYFAQVCFRGFHNMPVECCVSLGEADSLPGI